MGINIKRLHVLLILVCSFYAFCNAEVLWFDSFQGINDIVYTDPGWNVVNPAGTAYDYLYNRNDLIAASDTACNGAGFGPGAFGVGFYSRSGAVYTNTSGRQSYSVRGKFFDNGGGTRTCYTEVWLETDVNDNTGAWTSDGADGNETYKNAWRLVVIRDGSGANGYIEIYKYDDDGTRVKLADTTIYYPAEFTTWDFNFVRQEDKVTVKLGSLEYEGIDADYDPNIHNHIVLKRTISGSSDGDDVATGWTMLQETSVIWYEDFFGINGQIQLDPNWTAIQGGTRPYDRTNVMYALDDRDGETPLAYGKSMYSRFGAVYTTVPALTDYQISGFIWDEGGESGRKVWTEIYLETDVNTVTHDWFQRDLSGNLISYTNAWRIYVFRSKDPDEMLAEIFKYHDDSTRTKVASGRVEAAPGSSDRYYFNFRRQDTWVSVSIGNAYYEGFDSEYDPAVHDQLVIQRGVDSNPDTGAAGYGDTVDTGWGQLAIEETVNPLSCSEFFNSPMFNGDVNFDCSIDFEDVEVISENWLNCNDPVDSNCITYN